MAIEYRNELTPREREEMDYTREENDKNRTHDLERLKLQNELAKIEQRWNQIFRIPILIIMLPVKILIVLVLPLVVLAKSEHVADLLDLLKA